MNALETFLTSADPTPIVWVLNIETGSGLRTTVHCTPTGADEELLAYVHEDWSAACHYDETLPKDPTGLADAVDMYFEAVGWEKSSYNLDGLHLQV